MNFTPQDKNNVWLKLGSSTLIQAILALKNEAEVKVFFRDLMTEQELITFDMRWRIANMLDQGKTFSEIEKETSISPVTIARISKWLHQGCGGYKMLIDRLK